MVSITGHTVVATGMRVVLVNVLLAGQFLTFGGHSTTVYVDVEPDIALVSMQPAYQEGNHHMRKGLGRLTYSGCDP